MLLPPADDLRALLLAKGRLDVQQYSLAWGLVHFLVHRHAGALASLQERFARAWLLLAVAAGEPARAESALRRAVEVDPSSAAVRSALASYLLRSRRAAEALPHANEAVRLAPWSPPALDTLAAVTQALGRCPEALALQRRAVESIGDSDRSGPLKGYLDRLAGLERSCGGAPTP